MNSRLAGGLFWALLLIAPLPGLSVYLGWMSELEQYGYLLPLFLSLIALIAFRWDRVIRLPSEVWSLGLVTFGGVLTVFAAYRQSPWLSAIAFAILATGWLRTHWSNSQPSRRLTYLSLLFIVLIRLPLNLDLQLTTALQKLTSRVSSYMLDALGITHYLRGNVIELPEGTLFVEEACSGVQSLFTILFLACLWIVFRRRPLIATPCYIMAGIFWAMVMNVIRITTIAVAQEWYQTDLSSGTPHEVLGWLCLLAAILMMLSTDRLMRVWFYPVPPDETGHIGNPVSRLWNWGLSLGEPIQTPAPEVSVKTEGQRGRTTSAWIRSLIVAASLIMVSSFGFGYGVVASRIAGPGPTGERPLLWEPDAELMRTTSYASYVTNHQALRDANNKQLGNHADVWTLLVDGIPVRIAVSQPYPEWHDMRNCYSGSGWQVNDWTPALPLRTKTPRQSTAGTVTLEEWEVSCAELVSESGQFGTLLFSGLSRAGTPLSPPMTGIYSMLDNRMKDRTSVDSEVIMLQLWMETSTPISPDRFDRVRDLFESFREQVLNELAGSGGGSLQKEEPSLTRRVQEENKR